MQEKRPRLVCQRLRQDGWRWTVNAAFRDSFPAPLPERLDQPALGPECRILANRRHRCSYIVQDGWDRDKPVFVKVIESDRIKDVLKDLFRPSKARLEWSNTLALRRIDVPTAVPLAVGARRSRGWVRRSVLMTGAIEPVLSLAHFMKQPTHDAAARLLDQLARNVATMHAAGFYHRDLHGNNLLCRRRRDGQMLVLFVDLHEGIWLPRVPRRWAVRDLARLNASLTANRAARYRFLKRYLRERKLEGRQLRKRWAAEIEAFTRGLWRRARDRHGAIHQKYGPPI